MRGEDTLEKEMATHPVFLPWKFHGERRLVGYSPWDRKRVGSVRFDVYLARSIIVFTIVVPAGVTG